MGTKRQQNKRKKVGKKGNRKGAVGEGYTIRPVVKKGVKTMPDKRKGVRAEAGGCVFPWKTTTASIVTLTDINENLTQKKREGNGGWEPEVQGGGQKLLVH